MKRDLEALLEPHTRGDPQSPLRWTSKSVRNLSDELKKMGHTTSHRMVAELLHEMDFSLMANRKTKEGTSHPDRNAQFEYINETVKAFLDAFEPVISVDAKKRENIGDFKNGGREWQPEGKPESVRVHDFEDKKLGHAIPYGVYDMGTNTGWISVGIDHDTSAFAVDTIRCWWKSMGIHTYPNARRLLITADGGGSNGRRVKAWKVELQKLADELNVPITVCHLPPGTSKWNNIEHRLFSFITQNWRGKPLVSHEVIVNLIAATKTKKGLRVQAGLNTNEYPRGKKVSKQEFNEVHIQRHYFHGEWNYTIYPKNYPQMDNVIS